MRRRLARTWKQLKTFLTVTAVAAFLLLMPSRFTSPARVLFSETTGLLQTGVLQGTGELLAVSGTLTELFVKKDRERALTREVVRLRNANAALADKARRQKLQLESIARLNVKTSPIRALQARVSSYDASAMRRSITVRAGSTDGVGRGMAVAADGALVGIVQEVGLWQCRVRLITDPASAVPCRLSGTRTLCILQGTGGENCVVDWIDRDAFVEQGDTLVTASLTVNPRSELHIPDGLPAATVLQVQRDAMRPLFYAVKAAPRVNLNRLEGVEILIPD